jgi:dipeptidyl-peptidase-4
LNGNLTEGIEWSPDSKRLTYLGRTGRGENPETELWAMDAAAGKTSVLVDSRTLASVLQTEKEKTIQSTGLGRVQAANYLWSPRGDSLLFIGSNRLVLLDLKTMTSKQLVKSEDDIEDALFSPDGKWVSFSRRSNIWIVNIITGEMKALTTDGTDEVLKGKLDWVYPEELDVRAAYWWSPDSTKIAYYEMDERPVTRFPIMDMSSPAGAMEYTRYPQAGESNPIVRVGVVSVAGGGTIWMETGGDQDIYIPRVDWLRDSGRVAIQRLNRAQNRLDLLFCNAANGKSQTILTDTDKYWINISDDLYFFSDNKRFLWSSERSGFRHYYIYDISGRLLDQLTKGDWGIAGTGGFGPGAASQPTVDEGRGYLYFLSNKDNITQTQLYRLSLRDKSIARVTREAGTHDITFAPDSSAFVDTYSNSMNPPCQDLYRAEGMHVAAINENKVPELAQYHLSPVEFLDLSADDGTKIWAMMIKPPDFDPTKKYPVLITVYGGPQAQEVRDGWGGVDFLWQEMLAQRGYIQFTLDNRGSYLRGHAFETPIFHHFGKIELEDQLMGVKYLESLPYVDASRIGIWGWSYGGFLTLDAMFNAAGVFKAGVSVAPVSDWRLYDTIYTERYMGRPQDNPEGYRDSSPVHQARKLKGKLMLIHGTGDDNVHFANTTEVLNELILSGHYPASLMIFPGRGHPISDPPARIQLFDRITEFLLSNL